MGRESPSLPKAFVPGEKNLEHIMRKQYVYGYMVFFNINICRNNHEDVRMLTEYAHEHRIATDYHINETPMLEQDEHFKHLNDNPTYIRPEDWRAGGRLVDWLIEKNKAGYQMVNSVQRLQEIKAFVRMSSGLDLNNMAGTATEQGKRRNQQNARGTCRASCRTRTANCISPTGTAAPDRTMSIIRTDGTVAPCFPMYPSTFDWGNIDEPEVRPEAA